MQPGEEVQVQNVNKTYDYGDLLEFEDLGYISSIGKMRLSQNITAPKFSFGTATREKQQKVFQSKELSKAQFLGTIPIFLINFP